MATLSASIRMADTDVFHARLRPHGIRFRYRVLALFVDIDRIDEQPGIPLFSIGRFNFFGFDPADHGPRDGSSLRKYVDALHDNAGLPRPQRVVLTCFARILGYVFNPVAIYACFDEAGRMTSVIYEVRNTFGEHHSYLFPAHNDADGTVLAHECDKLFYVSPFMNMDLRYRFLIEPPLQDQFKLKIIEKDRDGVVLTALMQARAFAPTRGALLRRLAASPLAGFKVLVSIHWQALRLWLRGHHVRSRPSPPAAVSVETPGSYSLTKPNLSSVPHARTGANNSW